MGLRERIGCEASSIENSEHLNRRRSLPNCRLLHCCQSIAKNGQMKASPGKSDDHLEKLVAKIPCALTTHQPDEALSGEVEFQVGLQEAALLNFLGDVGRAFSQSKPSARSSRREA